MVSAKQKAANDLLAAWLAQNQPNLFNALAAKAAQIAGRKAPVPMKLNGFTDVLKSIGGSIGNAAKSVASGLSTTIKNVGNFLGTDAGKETMSLVGQTYGMIQTNKLAKQAVNLQTDRARAGLPPAPIEMAYDTATGQYIPTYNGMPLTGSQLQSASPMTQYLPYILIGGGLLLVVAVMRG